MFLKRVILEGFKSFADRTEFEFGPGITSIVGPNGCGKSNVLDAVRWVLGEQSARSLRGEAMADVIFSGSRSRKPAAVAEVQLVFDNRSRLLPRDEDEVSVGRLLYRSGDSEYRLNNATCRLKDIRELLLDTGVGVDAYSIIEQGRVDRLLAASPAERREIFEEAAGISRYRVRRTEAQRKLDRAQQNLLRLNDILEELERRLRSVKQAAGKARNFQEYDARLRELRSRFSLGEYHQLELAVRAARADIVAREEQIQARRNELSASDAECAEQSRALQRLDEEIQQVEGGLLELQAALSALEERNAGNERRLLELEQTRTRRGAQAADAARHVAELERSLADGEETLRELAAAEEQGAAQVLALQAARQGRESECAGSRAQLEREKLAAYDAVRRAALLQNQQANLEQERDRLTGQSLRLNQRREQVISERASLTQRVEQTQSHAREAEARITAVQAELAEGEARMEARQAAQQELEGRLAEAAQLRSGLISRLDLLRGMESRLEGVDAGTRAALSWRENPADAGGVLGLVADLLRIDDPRLGALQTVLTAFESHVVIENTSTLLGRLAERGPLPGALRVLALDRITPPPPRYDYSDSPGFVARAADWVTCAPEHRVLAEHLLGQTIVVDGLERALALAANAPPGFMFVTLDGHTVGADGRLTLGIVGSGGLISRKAEIRQLEQELDEVETTGERLTRARQAVRQELADLHLQREELLAQLAARQRDHADARTAELRLLDELQRLEREASVLEVELAGLRRAQDELAERHGLVMQQRAAAAEEEAAHQSQIDALTRTLAECEAAVTAAAEQLTAALVERTRVAEKRSGAEQALHEARRRLGALRQEQQAAEQDGARAVAQLEATRAALAEDRARAEAAGVQREERRAAALALRETRQAARLALEECGAFARDLQRTIEELESDLGGVRLALREAEVRQENLVARVRDELGVELPELYRAADGDGAAGAWNDEDWQGVEAEIHELRQKIARLGHVNLDALAELAELTPRCETMTAQRADLTNSIERLQALIVELDDESQARFGAAFAQIRENFQELFRKLFGGGKADVLLENPEQPLESGIEIIARPPGKEPQSISLLSGGEKTMTTVALLMAVFKSRPSPFAILDEVDAALDEANIERFNTMLEEFLAHSQFIVITHSKRTMQHADVLYGVTMEEPGVSQRVSVRFDDVRLLTPSVA